MEASRNGKMKTNSGFGWVVVIIKVVTFVKSDFFCFDVEFGNSILKKTASNVVFVIVFHHYRNVI